MSVSEYEARWEQGQSKRLYRSRWVLLTLRAYLSPDEMRAGAELARLYAQATGAPGLSERVDNTRNNAEGGMVARIDAIRTLNEAIEAVKREGWRCGAAAWSVASAHSLEQTMRACGLRRGSSRAARAIVQKTLLTVGPLLSYG